MGPVDGECLGLCVLLWDQACVPLTRLNRQRVDEEGVLAHSPNHGEFSEPPGHLDFCDSAVSLPCSRKYETEVVTLSSHLVWGKQWLPSVWSVAAGDLETHAPMLRAETRQPQQ